MRVPGLRRSADKVGGIVFFGRMLDKIRLNAAGRLPPDYHLGTGQYRFFYARCTRFLRVSYPELVTRVLQGGHDEEMLEWCFQQGWKPGEEDIEIWNDFMTKRGWHDDSTPALEKAKARSGLGLRHDIRTWFAFHDADEEWEEGAKAGL